MKNMNPSAILLIFALLFTQITYTQSTITGDFHKPEKTLQFDRAGNIIKSGDQRLEYNELESSILKNNTVFKSEPLSKDAATGNQMACEPVWKQAVMGTCIGLNSMNSNDFDLDGKTEIICSGGSGYSGGNFWYILEYNANSGEYEFEWVSDYHVGGYNGTGISAITYFDIENDGHWEIVCGYSNGNIDIYKGETMEVIRSIETSAGQINAIFFSDADNDGEKEIVLCDNSQTYFIEISGFTEEHIIAYGGDDFEPGNINQDENIELVYSNGDIIKYDGSSVTEIWNFTGGTGYEGYVELSDIDGDAMDEVIFARYWYYIVAYDADIESPKFQIDTDLDVDALLLIDVNGDGVDEILYGDGQWGDIYCHDAVTTSLMWNINNPEHGTTEINVADTDNDGQLEVLWGSGCSSSGSDHLFVHEIPSGNFEWQSKHIDPPFYSVEIADVDDDGTLEIVTLSHESNSGYDSGIMTIFNSEDHTIEWQCDENFFYLVWTGMYNMEVEDIDNDGETEIIVAAGRTYTGQLWVLNGSSHEIESNHIFSTEGLDEFYLLDVADVDSDGQMECIVGEGSYIHVIDPTDYSIEWTSTNLSGSPWAIYVANVDDDPNNEIIACYGYIYIIDGSTHQQWQSSGSTFRNIDIYDIDDDGVKDVIACNTNGQVVSINGQSHQTNILFEVEDKELASIKVADITGDGAFDYVFTTEGSVYFRTQSGQEMNTQALGTMAGTRDGLKLSDYDQNGKYEIITGTNFTVVEIDESCYNCLGFEIEMAGTDVSCNPQSDGVVEVSVVGGLEPYTYLWNNGENTAQLTGLEAGTYSVTVTDNQGCQQNGSITILQSYISAGVSTKKVGCSGNDDGTAEVEIIHGNPPYTFSWSTGDTSSQVSGLGVGDYWVEITDQKNCSAFHEFTIVKDTLIYELEYENIDCYGYTNGYAYVEVFEGEPPFNVEWSTGETGNFIGDLGAGDYSVTLTDALECTHTGYFTIDEPYEFLAVPTVTPDDPTTAEGEGTARVDIVGGGPPYYFQWYDPLYQTNQTAINLLTGEYMVKVTDANGCIINKTVFVPYINAIGENDLSGSVNVYPNPADKIIKIDLAFDEPCDATLNLHNILGQIVLTHKCTGVKKETIEIRVSDLPCGLYYLKVDKSGKSFSTKVQIF